VITVTIPIRTNTGLNAREHWRARSARVRAERDLTLWALAKQGVYAFRPCRVTLTRISPATRPCDDDNLPGGLKAVRDAIAQRAGHDDGDRRWTWVYAQERGPWGVRIEIQPQEMAT